MRNRGMGQEPGHALRGRSSLELMTAQLEAIDAWNQARRASETAAEAIALTREMRLDLSRRMDARLLECLARGGEPLARV